MKNDLLTTAETTHLELYSDGGYMSQLHLGGWGYVLYCDGEVSHQDFGVCRNTSSLEMELTAAVEALQMAKQTQRAGQTITLHTDSKILLEGLQGKIERYRQQQWFHKSGRPVESRELWERLQALTSSLKAEVKWVKGHNGNPGNQRADQLARHAMELHLTH